MIGTTISHYRIVEHLGGGGMGVVYRAEDTKLGREVALKFLPPEWSRDPAARERFLREARAASALEDSRICTVHDIDETDDGRLFIAMAFYEGETLKKRVERGRLPIGTAVEIAIQVAEGLERAHSADIVHRDIKPPNLMLTRRNEVVIVDFGLAKLAGELSLTKSGSSLGTPHYMSPEQARGDRVDGRTDLWSLGVVLYEMLAGRRPFQGENGAAVARAILDDEPLPLADFRPEAPPELGAIVAKALEKDAAKRYRSASQFLADLKGLQDQLSEREGLTEAAPSRVPARRRFFIAPVLVAAALFLGTVAVVWFLRSDVLKEPVETAPPRIVVLPFENLGPPEDEYFADGMTEEITSRLAAISGLRVISRTSAMQYKNTDKAIRQIGEELDVQYALEGTVRWERAEAGGGRVRITPQLIKVADDTHLWSDRYDRAIESIFQVQAEIAEQVIYRLQVALLEPEQSALEEAPTDNMVAYQAYLRGISYQQRAWDKQNRLVSTELLQRAVELDPEFAIAWAALARSHAALIHANIDRSQARVDLARVSAQKALDLAPGSPRVRLAVGIHYYFSLKDYDAALTELSIAAQNLPNDPEIFEFRGHILRRQGHFEAALREFDRAWNLAPTNSNLPCMIGQIHGALGRLTTAHEYFDRSIAIEPDQLNAFASKTVALWQAGSLERARAVLDAVPSVADPTALIPSFRCIQDMYEGDLGAALARASNIRSQWGGDPVDMVLEADLLFLTGQHDRAVAMYEAAREKFEDQLLTTHEDPNTHAWLGQALAGLGRSADAIREARQAVALAPLSKNAVDGAFMLKNLAYVLVRTGELDAAVNEVDHLLSVPQMQISIPRIRMDPRWKPLRDHPRFQALLEKYETSQR